MSNESSSLTPFPDYIWILLLFTFITLIVVLLNTHLGTLGNYLTQAMIPSVASIIAILSYRYAVRSNIRGALDELDPIRIDGKKIQPILYDLRWRPRFFVMLYRRSSGVLKHFIEILLLPRTALKFKLYDINGDDEYPADMEVFSRGKFSATDFEESKMIYPDTTARTLDVGIHNSQIDSEGIHVAMLTTNEKDVRRLADHVQRRVHEEVSN